MDVVWLSRLQFAAATYFHFLFVPLTLGLSILIAMMETRYARQGDPLWQRQARFWGQIFLINFAVGIVTGITLEFQFGTNWSRYSQYVGDIFGSLLAIEATAAFFLESTFIGVWIFGWKKLSAKAHAVVMWIVALASNLSAVWILTANAWMQHPVGYTINASAGRAELTDFVAIVTQPTALLKIIHTLSGAYVLAAFFVMGISAYHLLRKQHVEFFRRSFRLALGFGLIFSFVELVQGHLHASDVAATQPAKLAAMESHWETARQAPVYLLSIPDEEAGKNAVAMFPIPGVLSLLAFHDPNAEVKGLADFPKEDRPPVLITYVAFRLMVALGGYFMAATALGWLLRNRLEQSPWYLRLMLFSIPLPYLAIALGWTVAEVGRQPWIVYGLMRTRDAASPIAAGQVLATLVGFVVVYGLIGLLAFGLMVRTARLGPDAVPAPSAPKRGK
jgi:cytochrome d ubiquinol oxidase subunit I